MWTDIYSAVIYMKRKAILSEYRWDGSSRAALFAGSLYLKCLEFNVAN